MKYVGRHSTFLFSFSLLLALPDASEASVDLRPFCSQHDQGDMSTCHAFSQTCVIEKFEWDYSEKILKQTPAAPYRVSANWLAFASVTDRICRTGDPDSRIDRGYSPFKNRDRLMDMGYCAEKDFYPYSRLTGKGSDGGAPPKRTAVEKVAALILGSGEEEDRGPGDDGSSEDVESLFKEAFGISRKNARYVFCGDDAGRETRLAALGDKVSDRFRHCFKVAQVNRKKLKASCEPEGPYYDVPTKRKIQRIKDRLDQGHPVLVSVLDYADGDDHSRHAVSIVGYNDKGFLVRNSWGPGSNWRIPYSKAEDIYRYGTFNCNPGGAPLTPPATPWIAREEPPPPPSLARSTPGPRQARPPRERPAPPIVAHAPIPEPKPEPRPAPPPVKRDPPKPRSGEIHDEPPPVLPRGRPGIAGTEQGKDSLFAQYRNEFGRSEKPTPAELLGEETETFQDAREREVKYRIVEQRCAQKETKGEKGLARYQLYLFGEGKDLYYSLVDPGSTKEATPRDVWQTERRKLAGDDNALAYVGGIDEDRVRIRKSPTSPSALVTEWTVGDSTVYCTPPSTEKKTAASGLPGSRRLAQ